MRHFMQFCYTVQYNIYDTFHEKKFAKYFFNNLFLLYSSVQ